MRCGQTSGPGGGSGSQGSSGLVGSGSSPMFKSTPTTPPTSFTNYLFECPTYNESALGTLLLHPNTNQVIAPLLLPNINQVKS